MDEEKDPKKNYFAPLQASSKANSEEHNMELEDKEEKTGEAMETEEKETKHEDEPKEEVQEKERMEADKSEKSESQEKVHMNLISCCMQVCSDAH